MDVIDTILELAQRQDADLLLETTVAASNASLHDEAIQSFGSWDAALAFALLHVVGMKPVEKKEKIREVISNVERVRSSAADDPLYVSTTGQHFFRIYGEDVEIGPPRMFDTPPNAGAFYRLLHIGDPDGVFVFSNVGRYYGLVSRVIPTWEGSGSLRPLREILPALGSDERLMFIIPRSFTRIDRYVHVTQNGKGKATEISELGSTLDPSGRDAFLLKGDDVPVAVLPVVQNAGVFCASAFGQGIHFDSGEMRSMGRKAVGVNLMKLSGPDDRIVNAFVGDDVEQLAVITQTGFGKRIWFDDFRQQGRGGSGMQVMKLNAGDLIVGVVPTEGDDDLAIFLSSGRVQRIPSDRLEMMGRPAKGNRVLELQDGETVISMSVLPTSTSSS